MKTAIIGALFTTLLLSSTAFAQTDEAAATTHDTAPSGAVEITSGLGYSQGFGSVAQNRALGLGDLGRAGFASQLGVGYRLSPRFMIGAYGEFDRYSEGDGTPVGSRVSGAAAGVQAQYHFLPYNQFDPWVGVGSGWRGYWVTNEAVATHSLHGIDALRVTIGVDYRISHSLRITPLIGASLTTFLSEQRSAENEFSSIDSPTVNTFLFAGIGSRFDIGGTRVSANQEVASR